MTYAESLAYAEKKRQELYAAIKIDELLPYKSNPFLASIIVSAATLFGCSMPAEDLKLYTLKEMEKMNCVKIGPDKWDCENKTYDCHIDNNLRTYVKGKE